MQKKIKTQFWIPDIETYNQLQKLKQFVDFVAGLAYSTAENKTKADEIKLLIENIDKPETFLKEWLIALDIFDYDIQAGSGTGIYWKKWCVSCESGRLEIEAADEILDEQHFTETYPTYYGGIFFENDFNGERIYLDTNLDNFVADAMNYKSYLTEGLNGIEVEIGIWNKVR